MQIVADILSIVRVRAKKTRIMYQANLSYRLLCRYMDEVLDAGLIRPEDGDCYVLTARGEEFLNKHGEYSKRCQSLEKHLNNVNVERATLEKMCSSKRALKADRRARPKLILEGNRLSRMPGAR